MEKENKERLGNILVELEEIGEEIEDMMEKEKSISYELSEVGSDLVDARVELRKLLE